MVLFGCSRKIESKISCGFYIALNKLQDTDSKPVKGQEGNKNQEQKQLKHAELVALITGIFMKLIWDFGVEVAPVSCFCLLLLHRSVN